MTRTADLPHIESLWFEAGTAIDAATAINLHRPRWRHISAEGVRRHWKKAQREGRLPNFIRPHHGFKQPVRAALKMIVKQLGIRSAA